MATNLNINYYLELTSLSSMLQTSLFFSMRIRLVSQGHVVCCHIHWLGLFNGELCLYLFSEMLIYSFWLILKAGYYSSLKYLCRKKNSSLQQSDLDLLCQYLSQFLDEYWVQMLSFVSST